MWVKIEYATIVHHEMYDNPKNLDSDNHSVAGCDSQSDCMVPLASQTVVHVHPQNELKPMKTAELNSVSSKLRQRKRQEASVSQLTEWDHHLMEHHLSILPQITKKVRSKLK